MDASEVSRIVESEIGGDWSRASDYGVDLRRSLVAPVKLAYRDPVDETRTLHLWLVLAEDPGDDSSYEIVFDEESREFGLALGGRRGGGVFLGISGTFFDTLEGM